MTRLLLLTVFFASFHALACEPGLMHFEGTAFAKNPLEIENDKIYFYRDSAAELAVTYRQSERKWCYSERNPPNTRPKEACLERTSTFMIDGKPARNFVIRDGIGNPVATLNVNAKTLIVSFLSAQGKSLGKRLTLTSVKREFSESLEVKGWNCPNERFLSCAGSELVSVLESEPQAKPLHSVDLAKKLGHYRLSCNGITEPVLEETKRAPSSTEPQKIQSPNFN